MTEVISRGAQHVPTPPCHCLPLHYLSPPTPTSPPPPPSQTMDTHPPPIPPPHSHSAKHMQDSPPHPPTPPLSIRTHLVPLTSSSRTRLTFVSRSCAEVFELYLISLGAAFLLSLAARACFTSSPRCCSLRQHTSRQAGSEAGVVLAAAAVAAVAGWLALTHWMERGNMETCRAALVGGRGPLGGMQGGTQGAGGEAHAGRR